MDSPCDLRDDRDYGRGLRDGRMDALIPRAGAQAPDDASDAYLAGYVAGMEAVRHAVHQAA